MEEIMLIMNQEAQKENREAKDMKSKSRLRSSSGRGRRH